MSVNSVFRTSVSGMSAQASRLSVVSENIANSSTGGFKRSSTEFSSLILANSGNDYNSGTVKTQVRHMVSQQGSIASSTSASDLAIQGDGFFMVQDQAGRDYYTRAGAFVQKTSSDTGETNLVNAAGYRLTGTSLETGATEAIKLPVGQLIAPKSTATATLSAQLPSEEETGSATASKRLTFKVYDKLGAEHLVDVNITKTADDKWSMTVADRDPNATATTTPATLPTLDFTQTAGQAPGTTVAGAGSFTLSYADGTSVAVKFDTLTQYASDFSAKSSADGNPAGSIGSFNYTEDGKIMGVMGTGQEIPLYQLNVARFQSPDQLTPSSGNVYSASGSSGDPEIGVPGKNGFGSIISSATEQSNVDLASELTDMIESQRSYSANSKVFMTGSEILDVLVNLKR